jgi:hypothetical protein
MSNAEIVTTETGLVVLGDAKSMKQSLMQNKERMGVVYEFINDIFVQGVDYGKVDDRSQKETLKKPGAEKVCKFFNTTPKWRVDSDTWKMLGEPQGTVCYICEIVDNSTGNVVGEGRGAETIGNKKRDANKAIKNAEKCALVDAALYTFGLSERFTQDDGGKIKSTLEMEKQELIASVEMERVGIKTELTTLQFLGKLQKSYLNSAADTVGKVRKLRSAIIDEKLFDLSTADRL